MSTTPFIASELKRMLDTQRALDPSSDAYYRVMINLERLLQCEELYEAALNMIKAHYGLESKAEDTPKVVEFPGVDTTPFEATPATAPAVEETEETEETVKYKMEDVRAALVEARRKGMNVTELLKEFGVENFSAFPAGKYGELMARLTKV